MKILLREQHLKPDWMDSDKKALESFLRSRTGKKFYKLIECGVRSMFEQMASSRSNEDMVFYGGSARGLSLSLVLIEHHRQRGKDKKEDLKGEFDMNFVASSEPTIYE